MPDDAELGTREVHQTAIGGEHVLIRRARPEDVALYRDFLAGVSPRISDFGFLRTLAS
jgi:hypothetical protein